MRWYLLEQPDGNFRRVNLTPTKVLHSALSRGITTEDAPGQPTAGETIALEQVRIELLIRELNL